jgi:hypothetical protein
MLKMFLFKLYTTYFNIKWSSTDDVHRSAKYSVQVFVKSRKHIRGHAVA